MVSSIKLCKALHMWRVLANPVSPRKFNGSDALHSPSATLSIPSPESPVFTLSTPFLCMFIVCPVKHAHKHARALLLYMHICQYLRLQDQCHDPPHLQPIRSIKTTSFPDLCLTCGVAQIQAQAQDCNLGTDTHLRTHTTLAILS